MARDGLAFRRLYPRRFSKLEIQFSLQDTYNQTANALTIVISKEEARELEARAEPCRARVREVFAKYRPAYATASKT